MKRKSILNDLSSNYMKHTKSESGITLIALVVTIVVLLILAGVNISLVLGRNGILTQAKKAKLKNDQSDVLEATQIYAGNYEIEKNTQETNDTIINYLNKKNIIDSNNIINVEELLKKKLSTGQGTGNSDVYVIEQNSNKEYIVVYYDKEGNKTELGIFAKEVEEVADENILDIDNEGRISIREEYGYYETGWKNWTIKNLVIPDTINGKKVTKICRNFISGNNIIKSIKLPETVTDIEEYAFAGCNSLQRINMPETVTSIGTGAFSRCIALQSINIPETVTTIENGVFFGCIALQSINIPETVKIIKSAFYLNLSLKEITVDENNPNYSSKDGVLFDKTGKILILFPTCKEIETYEIPAETTTIVRGAFTLYPSEFIDMILNELLEITDIKLDNIPMLKRVIIPNTVTTVEEDAFEGGNTEQTIKVPFSSEATRPDGWNENWDICIANIEYTE